MLPLGCEAVIKPECTIDAERILGAASRPSGSKLPRHKSRVRLNEANWPPSPLSLQPSTLSALADFDPPPRDTEPHVQRFEVSGVDRPPRHQGRHGRR
ncbi:hypothetical protein CRX57_27625 [Pseudomonas putida]|uniref:Uncharacterized protein n=1 Tax=Pseudomonas putida TaxID=303 RepID=A0A2C5WHH8_PSEPU|nr:hypothetical protein CRX57_27625 [Pseudomonas putida]